MVADGSQMINGVGLLSPLAIFYAGFSFNISRLFPVMREFNSALDVSFREAQIFCFKAEKSEKKFARLQDEIAERDCKLAEDHARVIRRTERRGRKRLLLCWRVELLSMKQTLRSSRGSRVGG